MRRFVIFARRSLLHQCSLKLLDLRSSLLTLGRVDASITLRSMGACMIFFVAIILSLFV